MPNHSNYSEARTLLFQTRTTQLNKFIEDLIAQGKLADKLFEIQVIDPVMGYEQCRVSQSSQACYVYIREFASFEKLAQIVNYFAQHNWASFEYNPEKLADTHTAVSKFEQIIQSQPLPDISTYTSLPDAIWTLGDLQIKYEGDKMAYYLLNKKLIYSTLYHFPVRIQNRYLFIEESRLAIWEETKEIESIDIKRTDFNYFTNIKVYKKWINIGSAGHWYYSYSFDNNRFYKI